MPEPVYTALPERGLLTVNGDEARSFLQGLISNDVERVSAERSIYGALLTAQGKFLHDFFLAAWGDGLILDCEGDRRADLQRRLTLYKLRSKVQLADVTSGHAVFVAIGAEAAGRLGLKAEIGATAAFAGGIAFVDPRLADMGVRVIGEAAAVEKALAEAGLAKGAPEDYQRARIALALPDGSRDLPVDKAFLLESNFEELNGVDFKKGCYVGQELTARTKYRGLVRKRLVRVEGEGALPPPGTPIMLGEKEAGVMYSALDRSGLALIRLEHLAEAEETGQKLSAGEIALAAIKPAYAKF